MRLIGKQKLEKLKRKNRGNIQLKNEIEDLILAIESDKWKNQAELSKARPDADCVHSEGFFFFNIDIHRTMILVEFDDNEATVVWVGNHDAYVRTFKNNKTSIRKWLKDNNWIEK